MASRRRNRGGRHPAGTVYGGVGTVHLRATPDDLGRGFPRFPRYAAARPPHGAYLRAGGEAGAAPVPGAPDLAAEPPPARRLPGRVGGVCPAARRAGVPPSELADAAGVRAAGTGRHRPLPAHQPHRPARAAAHGPLDVSPVSLRAPRRRLWPGGATGLGRADAGVSGSGGRTSTPISTTTRTDMRCATRRRSARCSRHRDRSRALGRQSPLPDGSGCYRSRRERER